MEDNTNLEVLHPFRFSSDGRTELLRSVATFLEMCTAEGLFLAGTVALTHLVGSHNPQLVSFVQEGLLDPAMSITAIGGAVLTFVHLLMAQERKVLK